MEIQKSLVVILFLAIIISACVSESGTESKPSGETKEKVETYEKIDLYSLPKSKIITVYEVDPIEKQRYEEDLKNYSCQLCKLRLIELYENEVKSFDKRLDYYLNTKFDSYEEGKELYNNLQEEGLKTYTLLFNASVEVNGTIISCNELSHDCKELLDFNHKLAQNMPLDMYFEHGGVIEKIKSYLTDMMLYYTKSPPSWVLESAEKKRSEATNLKKEALSEVLNYLQNKKKEIVIPEEPKPPQLKPVQKRVYVKTSFSEQQYKDLVNQIKEIYYLKLSEFQIATKKYENYEMSKKRYLEILEEESKTFEWLSLVLRYSEPPAKYNDFHLKFMNGIELFGKAFKTTKEGIEYNKEYKLEQAIELFLQAKEAVEEAFNKHSI
jgi:hypothetical protein